MDKSMVSLCLKTYPKPLYLLLSPSMKPNLHRLLLDEDETFSSSTTTTTSLGFPSFSTLHHLPPPPHHPKSPTPTIDSTIALTTLILFTALFFIGLLSVYARCLSNEASTEISRRRQHELQRRRAAPNPSSSHGLDPDAVRALPCFAYGLSAKQPADCAVCLSEFAEEQTVKIIPRCGHVYHPHCIDSWLQSHGSCPLCRCTRLFPRKKRRSGWKCPAKLPRDSPERTMLEKVGGAAKESGWRRCEGRGAGVGERRRERCSTGASASDLRVGRHVAWHVIVAEGVYCKYKDL